MGLCVRDMIFELLKFASGYEDSWQRLLMRNLGIICTHQIALTYCDNYLAIVCFVPVTCNRIKKIILRDVLFT